MNDMDASEDDGARTAPGPRAMSRVLQLFTALARHRKGMTLSQISQELEAPKSTLLNSLRPLVSDGYLVADGPLYKLGPHAFRFAAGIMASFSMPELIETYIRNLAEQTHELVGFAIGDWKAGRMIYIKAVPSPQPVVYAMVVGVSAPLYASAGGRVLLAYAPEEARDAYLARGPFRPLTDRTEVDPDRLRQKLIEIRDQGYCVSFGEMLSDTAAMAAPVFEGHGATIGALVIGAPIERMRANEDALLQALVATAQRASGLEAGQKAGFWHL